MCGSRRAFPHRAQVGLPSVGDEVALQFRQLGKGVSTVWAVVRALPHMQPQVPMQAALLVEHPATVWAQEGLLPHVQQHVIPQRALVRQELPTHGARAWGRGRGSLRCSRREGRQAKALPHWSQVKGRAPECTTCCSLRSRRVL